MTLLESLVVVALTVLLTTLAFPSLEHSARLMRYQEARVRLLADTAEARARAITGDRTVALRQSADGAAYATADGRTVALPAGLRLIAPDGMPAFGPDGSAAGGAMLLAGDGWRSGIAVDPVTGLATATGR